MLKEVSKANFCGLCKWFYEGKEQALDSHRSGVSVYAHRGMYLGGVKDNDSRRSIYCDSVI